MKKLFLVAAALMLAGCTQHFEHNKNAVKNSTPASSVQKAGILNAARNFLYDPYSVRDAEISNVVTWLDGFGTRTQGVCVRFNSKNALGGYTGRKQYLLYLMPNGNVLRANTDMFAQHECNKMTFTRFNEADKLRDL